MQRKSFISGKPAISTWLILGFGVCCLLAAKAAPKLPAAPPAPASSGSASRMTAGPSYTSADGKGNPKFPEAEVLFAVIGGDGSPVAVKTADLKLISQGREIATTSSIRTFEQTGYGITAILALDASGSMKGAPINAIHASIAKFVKQERTQDKVAVITFADDTKVDVPFGSPQENLTRELETVQARGKFTRLYDGLLDAMDQYNGNQPKRRQLVVISDGHDEGSKHTLADVIVKAKAMSVVVDGIGLTKDKGEYLTSLQQLARETGGSYRRAAGAQDLEVLIDQGIQATRATPVAKFKITNLTADDKVHSIQLRWTPGNLSATVFLKTPKANLLTNLWIWGLALCFVAGIVLLVLSLRGARRKPPVPATLPAVAAKPAWSAAPAMPPASAAPAVRNPTISEAAPRLPTLSEPAPFHSAKPEPTISFPVVGTGTASGGSSGQKSRTRTQLAVQFDADENGPYALIEIRSGAMAGKSVLVSKPSFTLGAVRGDLLLTGDATVSGQHARLTWEANILKIEDLGSTNGTFHNGTRLAPGRCLLRPGDELRMGQVVMVVNQV